MTGVNVCKDSQRHLVCVALLALVIKSTAEVESGRSQGDETCLLQKSTKTSDGTARSPPLTVGAHQWFGATAQAPEAVALDVVPSQREVVLASPSPAPTDSDDSSKGIHSTLHSLLRKFTDWDVMDTTLFGIASHQGTHGSTEDGVQSAFNWWVNDFSEAQHDIQNHRLVNYPGGKNSCDLVLVAKQVDPTQQKPAAGIAIELNVEGQGVGDSTHNGQQVGRNSQEFLKTVENDIKKMKDIHHKDVTVDGLKVHIQHVAVLGLVWSKEMFEDYSGHFRPAVEDHLRKAAKLSWVGAPTAQVWNSKSDHWGAMLVTV